MTKRFTCSCGNKTLSLRYYGGKTHCDKCSPQNLNLSGAFERRINSERQQYAKDILQPKNKDGSVNEDFVKVYGKGKNVV